MVVKLKEEWNYKKLDKFPEFKEEIKLQKKVRNKLRKLRRKILCS